MFNRGGIRSLLFLHFEDRGRGASEARLCRALKLLPRRQYETLYEAYVLHVHPFPREAEAEAIDALVAAFNAFGSKPHAAA